MLVLWLILPGLVLLIAEGLIVSLTIAEKGCLVLPILAVVTFLLTLLGCETASGWDNLAWGIYAMMAGSGVIGALLGGGIGLLVRVLLRRKARRHPSEPF